MGDLHAEVVGSRAEMVSRTAEGLAAAGGL